MAGTGLKVATVEVADDVDNMATLPVSRAHGPSDVAPEKNNFTNKEMELRKVRPQPPHRYTPSLQPTTPLFHVATSAVHASFYSQDVALAHALKLRRCM
ncbi:hypothetical protein PR048_027036 [Dryococelus australis]|uniref:Uncharacterized protein n=1 Tax=Dryococelus australis TaxID=614101 RepID=A0ABQ9GEV1_9NEOP|nr:hypothetical protein PR048_027036 [Dryococelus australis]